MSSKEVILELKDHVATISLNRPKHGNSLTLSMIKEFLSIFQELEANPSISIIVITGKGKYFCTGMDLQQTESTTNNKDEIDSIEKSYEIGTLFYDTIKSSTKTVISKINGPALGGGIGLVFVSDIRICNEDKVYFCFSEIKRGLIPAIISQFIVAELGTFKTRQYMLTGERISAKQAREDGFISTLAGGDNDLNEKVEEYIETLLSSAPKVMGKIKKLVQVLNDTEIHNKKRNFIKEQFLEMMKSEEAIYGIEAYRMKQKPNWYKSKL
ncbi:6098_t:CDS:1 [Funneliformis geosporum]|uniref:14498_t:CDS:1 n=1 Tax=Funneliformis geosporum TaxID=1117311 RepID=A0A9W4WU05_9GLOM|nr:14498_t:CDS:1 [Funneliformis geosporum]CAI2184311.1 6098_t:CDS:1 [Funneliformis geosporum]